MSEDSEDGGPTTLDEGAGEATASRPTSAPPPTGDYEDFERVDPKHFVIGKEIARGGMGRILAARDRRLGRPVAIKELLHNVGPLRARFEREARITAKLQHPAIVNILEAGEWPSGEPFYVMKLVTGETFDRVIAQCTTLEQRLRLLSSVIAIVDALAYAHSKQVIHRDLKPQNVLVGEFGETVVIDWGLAKELSEPDGVASAPPVRRSAANIADGATVVGAVIGTPAYMPPEQARGDAVDMRADVYSLGAILYHVLVGTPPFPGVSTDEVLRRVIEDDPPPIASKTVGVPRDLLTIVEKAMARDPAERYPTAAELADDLKKFQTGQLVGAHEYSAWQLVKRWARVHRTAIGVAGVALVVLVVLGGLGLRRIFAEQRESERLGKIAERRRGQAEELLSFMLGDLRDKLLPLGKLDVLKDVATKAVTYFDDKGDALSDADLALRAETQRQLADVLLYQGDAAGARRVIVEALSIANALAARDPSNAARQFELAASHHQMGAVAGATGDTRAALASYRTERAILETLTARDPANVLWQRTLSLSEQSMGRVLKELGDLTGAIAAFRDAAAVRTMLVAKEPANAERLRDLVIIRLKIGETLDAQGDLDGALVEFRAALAVAERQVAQDPKNADWQTVLAQSHQKVGEGLDGLFDTAGALAGYRAALAVYERLAAADPSDAFKQADVAAVLQQIGSSLLDQRDPAAATQVFRRALAISEALAARDPASVARKAAVGLGLRKLGAGLGKLGDHKGALAEFQKALSIALEIMATDSEKVDNQIAVLSAREGIGDTLAETGDVTRAIAEYQATLAIAKAIAQKDPSEIRKQRGVAVQHKRLAEAQIKQGDFESALAEYRAAREIHEALLARDPAGPERLYDVANAHQNIGDVLLLNQGNAKAAVVEYRAAAAAASALVGKGPTVVDYLSVLSDAQESVGDALFAQGDRAGATAAYKTAQATWQRVAAIDPKYEGYAENAALLAKKVAGR